MKRPYNTLYMLTSVDGKISTGVGPDRDVDKDYKEIKGVKEGLNQYYEIEQQTDLVSMNSGKVMAKIGVNSKTSPINNSQMTFIIIDNSHLTEKGILNLSSGLKQLYLVTSNPNHSAHGLKIANLKVITYENEIDYQSMFEELFENHQIKRITVQTGGTLNSVLLRLGLIDEISIVCAPLLVGGQNTPSLIDGNDILLDADLKLIKPLELLESRILKNSYIHSRYRVIN